MVKNTTALEELEQFDSSYVNIFTVEREWWDDGSVYTENTWPRPHDGIHGDPHYAEPIYPMAYTGVIKYEPKLPTIRPGRYEVNQVFNKVMDIFVKTFKSGSSGCESTELFKMSNEPLPAIDKSMISTLAFPAMITSKDWPDRVVSVYKDDLAGIKFTPIDEAIIVVEKPNQPWLHLSKEGMGVKLRIDLYDQEHYDEPDNERELIENLSELSMTHSVRLTWNEVGKFRKVMSSKCGDTMLMSTGDKVADKIEFPENEAKYSLTLDSEFRGPSPTFRALEPHEYTKSNVYPVAYVRAIVDSTGNLQQTKIGKRSIAMMIEWAPSTPMRITVYNTEKVKRTDKETGKKVDVMAEIPNSRITAYIAPHEEIEESYVEPPFEWSSGHVDDDDTLPEEDETEVSHGGYMDPSVYTNEDDQLDEEVVEEPADEAPPSEPITEETVDDEPEPEAVPQQEEKEENPDPIIDDAMPLGM